MASGVLKEKISFNKKSIVKSNDLEKSILEMQRKELESETFRKVSLFLDRYNRRQSIGNEKYLFEVLEKADYEKLRFFLNSLSKEELNSNVYLCIAKKALRKIQFNCSKRTIRLNQDLYTDESKEVGELTFDLSEDMEDFVINKVNTSIDIIKKDGKEEVEVLDKKNIQVYKEYNEVVDQVNSMMMKLYYVVFTEIPSKLSVVVDDIKLVTSLNHRKVVIKYHVLEEVLKLFRDEDAKAETLKDSIFTREQIVNMSLHSFSHYLNNMVIEKQKQKIFPN